MCKQSWLLPFNEFLLVWAKAGQHQTDTTECLQFLMGRKIQNQGMEWGCQIEINYFHAFSFFYFPINKVEQWLSWFPGFPKTMERPICGWRHLNPTGPQVCLHYQVPSQGFQLWDHLPKIEFLDLQACSAVLGFLQLAGNWHPEN